ncbi:MAG: transketolase C-terminal domain-containing protein [Planctomycetota bacterium]
MASGCSTTCCQGPRSCPARAYHEPARDLLIVTYGNGVRLSLRAATRRARARGRIRVPRVLDVRWLNPLPMAVIGTQACRRDCGKVLVVDECCATGGGIAAEVIAELAEQSLGVQAASVRAADSYIPLGAAANLVLVQEADIAAGDARPAPWSCVAIMCPGRGLHTEHSLGSLPEHAWVRSAGGRVPPTICCPCSSWIARRSSGRRCICARRTCRRSSTSPPCSTRRRWRPRTTWCACSATRSAGTRPWPWWGALSFEDGFRLVQEVALAQESWRGGGGQIFYPLVQDDWTSDAERAASVAAALAAAPGEAFLSIELGGYVVLAGSDAGLALLEARLPPIKVGASSYPWRLAQHGPYHTPLLAGVAARARERLRDLAFHKPRCTLIDGRGVRFTPWSASVSELARYTLGPQITEPFSLTTGVRVLLREHAPDLLVLPGPGNTLGGVCGQILVAEGWRGIHRRADFERVQASDRPVVWSLRR